MHINVLSEVDIRVDDCSIEMYSYLNMNQNFMPSSMIVFYEKFFATQNREYNSDFFLKSTI